MTQTSRDLDTLRENDILNLLLFCIYKLTDDPKYSTISELIYVLDKESLYKLCATFGGCEIKIPTIQDLKTITNVLLVYQYVDIDGMTFANACAELSIAGDYKKEVLRMYNVIKEVVAEYEEA